MRILHFLWSLHQGGAENLAIDLANHQSREHDVVVLVGNDCVNPEVRAQLNPAVRFIALKRPEGSKNPYWIARLLWTLHRLRPDVIHSHMRDLVALRRLIFKPMILTVHSVNMDLSEAMSGYACLCCISETVFLDVQQRCPGQKIRRIDNGIVVSNIAMAPHRAIPPVLRGVQVSRLVHLIKGQDLLIRALAVLNAKQPSPQLTLDFIGDGPSQDYLVQLAEELGVDQYCNFLGARSRNDVYAHLCDYDMLIQPSRNEGFGLTVAEGMAAGIPVLVSDIEAPMEVIGNGQHGYSFQSNDVAALVDELETVIADIRSGVAQQRALAARHYVEEKYGMQRMAQQYGAIYREVVAEFEGAQ